MPYEPTGFALDPNDNVVAAFGYGSTPRANALENLIQTFRPRPDSTPNTPSLMAWLNDNKAIVYSAAALLVLLAVLKAKR